MPLGQCADIGTSLGARHFQRHRKGSPAREAFLNRIADEAQQGFHHNNLCLAYRSIKPLACKSGSSASVKMGNYIVLQVHPVQISCKRCRISVLDTHTEQCPGTLQSVSTSLSLSLFS